MEAGKVFQSSDFGLTAPILPLSTMLSAGPLEVRGSRCSFFEKTPAGHLSLNNHHGAALSSKNGVWKNSTIHAPASTLTYQPVSWESGSSLPGPAVCDTGDGKRLYSAVGNLKS